MQRESDGTEGRAGRNFLNSGIKAAITTVGPPGTHTRLWCSLPSEYDHEETPEKPKLKDSLENKLSGRLQTILVKERPTKTETLFQIQGSQRDVTAKCNL